MSLFFKKNKKAEDSPVEDVKGTDPAAESGKSLFDDTYAYIPEDAAWVNAIKVIDWRDFCSAYEKPKKIAADQKFMPLRITNGLYLADSKGAMNVRRLKKMGITAVVGVMNGAFANSKMRAFERAGITYTQVKVKPHHDDTMLSRHFEVVHRLVNSPAHKNVLVHCPTGADASGLMVACEYMLTSKCNLIDTIKHMRRCRGNAALRSMSSLRQLVAFARVNGQLGEKPESEEKPVVEALNKTSQATEGSDEAGLNNSPAADTASDTDSSAENKDKEDAELEQKNSNDKSTTGQPQVETVAPSLSGDDKNDDVAEGDAVNEDNIGQTSSKANDESDNKSETAEGEGDEDKETSEGQAEDAGSVDATSMGCFCFEGSELMLTKLTKAIQA